MREIKFRAWTQETSETMGEMVYAEINEILNGFKASDFRIASQGNTIFEIMQYTGLKDRRGKEIYEGDIVIIDGYTDEKVIVEYMNGRYLPFYTIEDRYPVPECCEVIGNIYENPELLNES